MTKKSDDLTRRQLLTIGGAAGLAAVTAGASTAEAQGRNKNQGKKQPGKKTDKSLPQIPRRVLGKTGRKIPILAVGGSHPWNQHFDPKMPEALRFGAFYFDSSRVYEGSETALAAFHTRAKVRDRIWITSKSKMHDPAGFEKSLGESLARLKTDHVEMYYLHAVRDPAVFTRDLARKVAALKKSGKMHFFGFSCHHGNVPELLHEAARHDWIDSVMFRCNFRQYGNKELNKAIDAAHKARVGLIAMKTQGSEASFRGAWQKFEKTGKWNKFQAVLKAIWEDERLTAAVSEMDSFDKLRQNIAAALDTTKLGAVERQAIERYAQATRHMSCDGCDQLCSAALPGTATGQMRIGDTMRYLMYHDVYDKKAEARQLFAALPETARAVDRIDFTPAQAACPHGVALVDHMARAAKVLA